MNLQLAVNTLEMQSEELTNQMTDNSMDLRLTQKYTANEIQAVEDKYAPQEQYIKNQIESLDKSENRDEYQDLIAELKDLKDEKSYEIEKIETEASYKEEDVNVENATLESQKEAVDSDKNTFKEALQQAVEEEFSYFQ